MLSEKTADGASPFEDHDCGHLPCPPWLEGDAAVPQAAAPTPQADEPEPELDPPHHVHDLWAVLGLGEG